jgi:hypothetical protein
MNEERWQRLVAYLRRARSKPNFVAEEREYRLEVAAELREILELATAGGAWQERLRGALKGHFARRKYDLTGLAQLRWLEALPAEAFRSFLDAEADPVERFARFMRTAGEKQPKLESDPETWTNPDVLRDAALSFGSLFNFASDPENLPVVSPDVFNLLEWTLGYAWTFRIPLVEQYRRHLAFAEDVRERLGREGVPARDMLDVGSLVQTAGTEPDHWTSAADPTRKHYLSICAIYRNEAVYLPEWLEFHRLVGVEHFFLYDNGSEDNHLDVLAPYLEEGVVTLHEWPAIDGQLPAYDDCLRWHRHDSRWMAFIDVDEFLFSPTGRPVAELLPEYEAWPAVAVAWVMFGHAGHRTRPPGLVIENYQGRIAMDHLTTNVKCIVDPTRATRFISSHHLDYPYLTAVDENQFPVHGAKALPGSSSRLRLNHYFYKSEQEYLAKCERWRAVGKPFRKIPTAEDFERVRREESAGVTDDTVLMYVPELRSALAKRDQAKAASIQRA